MGSAPPPVLVVAATVLELEPLRAHLDLTPVASAWDEAVSAECGGTSVVLQALGLGKANTAAGLVAALAAWRPRAVVQVGIGGAYLGSFLSVGTVAVADEDLDLGLGLRDASGWRGLDAIGFALTPARAGRPERGNAVPTHPGLTAALRRVADLPPVRFATVETLTADVEDGGALARRHDVSVESMEGVAAAQVCDRLGVAFAQVRGVSNIVGDRDRARWDVRAAVHRSCDVVRALLQRWQDLPETAALAGDGRW
jgi:futalosine hydrolase